MNKKTKPKEKGLRRLTVLLTPDQFNKLEEARASFQKTTGFDIGMSPFAARAMEQGLQSN